MVKSVGKACGAVVVLGAERRQKCRSSLIYSFASSFSDGFTSVLGHLNNYLSALIQMINTQQALNLGNFTMQNSIP